MTHQFHQGDCREVLTQRLEAGDRWTHCVTSPPYFQQIDYELQGQYGLEERLVTYLVRQADLFDLVWQGMEEGGVCWIIVGDTMNNYSPIRTKRQRRQPGQWSHRRQVQEDYTEKEALMVPYQLAEYLRAGGWLLRKMLIWDKGQSGQPGKGDAPGECHESVLMLGKWSKTGRPYLNTAPLASTVLRHSPASHPNHPCVYPQSLAEELLASIKQPSATVLDPYVGTGTTARACDRFGHRCIGIDLSLKHLEVSNVAS
ncbi:MAG: site-specific DNA-methyltransferase [Cyanobacteria bacterium P01_F01_bin.3]